jgi:CheY-like chemotaxis protein
LQTKVLDLNTVVANMNQMLARLIGGNIELSFVAQPGLWPVKVDPGQIAQVLMNLAVNARDAMPDGGRLTIETKNLNQERVGTNGGTVTGDYVLLSVRDTGHGMDESTKARIFEPFFTTKEAGKGTGLGLAVVYGIVKQSGGQVLVESSPNCGTMFKIYIPRGEGSTEDVRESVRAEVPGGTETILLVDDDKSVRDMIADFLKNRGYRVLVARDGADAISVAESSGEFDLLVSDLTMPNIGGRELARRLKEAKPNLKTILMSGNPEAHESAVGYPRFIQKPFSMHELAQAMRTVLDEKKTKAMVGSAS